MGRKKRLKKVSFTRGFGTRYGSTVKKRYIRVLSEMRKEHRCFQCDSKSVHRESVGVWNCKKCGLTFAGGAYSPVTKLGVMARRAAS